MAKKRKKTKEISLLFWDLEEDGYRSFSASRFIGFEVMENSEKYGQLSSRGSK